MVETKASSHFAFGLHFCPWGLERLLVVTLKKEGKPWNIKQKLYIAYYKSNSETTPSLPHLFHVERTTNIPIWKYFSAAVKSASRWWASLSQFVARSSLPEPSQPTTNSAAVFVGKFYPWSHAFPKVTPGSHLCTASSPLDDTLYIQEY